MPKSDLRLDMPMTISHTRLIWRHFATTPERRAALIDGVGLSAAEIDSTATVMSIRQQVRFFENANRIFAPGWIFEVSELLHFSAFGPIGVATQSAPTLGDAIGILCRFTQIRTPMARISLRRGRSRTRIELDCIADVATPTWHIVATVGIMALRSLIAGLITLPAPSLTALRFGLAGVRTVHSDALAAELAVPVAFGQTSSFISLPTSWLAVASPFADPALHASALASLEAMALARTGGGFASDSLQNRVAQLLAQAPPGRLDAARCAQMIGVSRRTLTRRLGDEGSGFRGLLEAELQRRARRLLATGLAVADVAEQLGYQDTTSLRRAMARWARAAPAQQSRQRQPR
ncbi:MAG: AraC family transcriptional regulator ligand-binding domain-containing protein [Polymorphobacter sp.]